MSQQQNDGGGGGWIGVLIGLAIVLTIIFWGLSSVGHMLGLTPTFSEATDRPEGWVSEHYEGVVAGYILTLVLIVLFAAWMWLIYAVVTNADRAAEIRPWTQRVVGSFVAILVFALVLPVGPKEEELAATDRAEAASPDRADRQAAKREQEALMRRIARRDARIKRLERERRQRARARAAERRERREEQAALAAAAAEPEPAPQPAASDCHPSYDPCLDPNAADYDCEGGSGDGPEYTGPVTVSGSDDYDLDRDGDGSACEPY